MDTIKSLNNLKNNTLKIGQVLKVPTTTNNNYIVKKGDSLYSIANKYNTTVNAIKSLNNLKSNTLQIGQILKIPSNTTSGTSQDYTNYVVAKGDSLYSIANKFNTTVNTLKSINNLSSNLLSIGQIIKIPNTNNIVDVPTITDYETYTVKRGDTLYKIASLYNMSINELKSINNLTSNVLSIGQILKVKKNEFTPPKDILECIGNNYTEKKYETYIVKRGDSLYSIANKFNTSVSNLIKLNNLSSTALQIGQILNIREVN